MSMRSVFLASLLNSASKVERNGLRDIGLLPELERSCWPAGEWRFGDAALLRKGLLEERLSVSPGDGRRSVIREKIVSHAPVSSPCSVKQATGGPYLALMVPRT